MRYQSGCFEQIFNPKYVAVVSVSTEGLGFGKGILLSLSLGWVITKFLLRSYNRDPCYRRRRRL